jgi:DNA invertase Pin-like site-specific DNA recombinase
MSPWSKISEDFRQKVIRTYVGGSSIRQTALLCGVNPTTVKRILKSSLTPCRHAGEWKKIDRKEVTRLKKAGHSVLDIAYILEVSVSGIRKVISE